MKRLIIKDKRNSIKRKGTIRPCEPLEQEVARMKRERMPVRGGATPIYGEVDGVVYIECDYREGVMDRARKEISSVMREREMERAKAANPTEIQGGSESKEE